MFIRKKEVVCKKTGKKYQYCKLVETVQTENGPRQRMILHLGELDLTKAELKSLGKLLEMRISGKQESSRLPSLSDLADTFMEKYHSQIEQEAELSREKAAANYQNIDINTVSVGHHRSFGQEFVATSFWHKLGFEKLLSELGFSGKERSLSAAMILGRLISPGSELHTFKWFRQRSSLNEMLSCDLSEVGKDAFYEIGDLLYHYKEIIETRLRSNLQKRYSLHDSIYLYDLTNTYFEGIHLKSDLAKRGWSKEKRYDCPLVTLALVVDSDGFTVHSEIYGGNQSEPETLPEILAKIFRQTESAVVGTRQRTIIMDKGIATAENIQYLRDNDYSYIVVERRNAAKDYQEEFSRQGGFTEYQTSDKNSVFLKKIEEPEVDRVLVFSTGKARKEESIISSKESRFLSDADRLIVSNRKGNLVLLDKINIRIGRLYERYGAIAGCYRFDVQVDSSNPKRVVSITVEKTGKPSAKQEYSGCYVIETDRKGYSEKEIWDLYMRLNQVESAFRSLKSQLGTRPVFHQIDSRIRSHLFIAVLAYSILHSIEYELAEKGMNTSWSSIREILSTHQRSTVFMKGEDGIVHELRVNGKPEKCHNEIYQKLNLKFKFNRKYHDVKVRM